MTAPPKRTPSPLRAAPALLAALGLACGCATLGAAEEVYRIGFLTHVFGGVTEQDTKAAFNTWAQVIGREFGVTLRPDSRMYRDHDDALAASASGELDMISMTSIDYLTMRGSLPSGVIMTPARRDVPGDEYLLVCHRDSPGRTLADFRGKVLLRQPRATAQLGRLWLETELHRAGLPLTVDFFASAQPVAKPAKALLPVYFRQADLCLVTRAAFETACEMNPQLAASMHIVARSPPLVASLVWVALPPGSPFHQRMFEMIRTVHTTPSGRQTFLLFGFTRLDPCAPEALETCRQLLRQLPPAIPDASAYLRDQP